MAFFMPKLYTYQGLFKDDAFPDGRVFNEEA